MKKKLLVLAISVFFIACSGSQPTAHKNLVEKIEKSKKIEYEKTISYQDIIMKINDINTNKKTNKRVKNIIKEYRYNTSDDDSKNSARKKAITQVKILILEEIGVFVESYLQLNKVVENKKYQEYFKQEIKSLTAGIIKTKILDEKYDGNTYYVKASVLVDPDSVSEGISEILKIKANKSEITKLTKLLKSKENEIDMRSSETIKLQKKIANQELLNSAKVKEIETIKTELQSAKKKVKKVNNEKIIINKKLQVLKNKELELKTMRQDLKATQLKLKSFKSEKKKLSKLIKTNKSNERKLSKIRLKLQKAQQQLKEYQREELILTNKLSKIEKKVYNILQRQKQKAKKACVIKTGLLKSDVLNILGRPDYAKANYGECIAAYQSNCTSLFYGKTVIYFNRNFVNSISGCY